MGKGALMIPYLIKREIVFICTNCGESTSMIIPHSRGTVERSYCCKACYRLSVDALGNVISLDRIADKEITKAIATPPTDD